MDGDILKNNPIKGGIYKSIFLFLMNHEFKVAAKSLMKELRFKHPRVCLQSVTPRTLVLRPVDDESPLNESDCPGNMAILMSNNFNKSYCDKSVQYDCMEDLKYKLLQEESIASLEKSLWKWKSANFKLIKVTSQLSFVLNSLKNSEDIKQVYENNTKNLIKYMEEQLKVMIVEGLVRKSTESQTDDLPGVSDKLYPLEYKTALQNILSRLDENICQEC